MTKMTYATALEIAIATVENIEAREKLEALKIQVEKKSSATRKPTATQTANANFKTQILEGMEVGKSYTITELTKSIEGISELSNQRVSALVRQLCEANLVTRSEIKRKAYFTKAEA